MVTLLALRVQFVAMGDRRAAEMALGYSND